MPQVDSLRPPHRSRQHWLRRGSACQHSASGASNLIFLCLCFLVVAMVLLTEPGHRVMRITCVKYWARSSTTCQCLSLLLGLFCAGYWGSALSIPSCQTAVTLALAESGSNSETAHCKAWNGTGKECLSESVFPVLRTC